MKKKWRNQLIACFLTAAVALTAVPVYAADSADATQSDTSSQTEVTESVDNETQDETIETVSSSVQTESAGTDESTEAEESAGTDESTEAEKSAGTNESVLSDDTSAEEESAVTDEIAEDETAADSDEDVITSSEDSNETDSSDNEISLFSAEDEAVETDPVIVAQAHIQKVGNSGQVKSSSENPVVTLGTKGQGLRLEALRMHIEGDEALQIQYRAHVQGTGWQDWKTGSDSLSSDEVAGTVGQGKRIEAVQIRLTGDDAQTYDVYYRVYVQKIGWMGWTKNGSPAGTTCASLRVEAVQIALVPDGSSAPDASASATNAPYFSAHVSYSAYVQKNGWMNTVSDGATAGTTEKSLRVEALRVKTDAGNGSAMGISYRAYVQGSGWMDETADGGTAGTTGKKRRMEAVQIRLTGAGASYFDVWYRVYVQNVGWLAWTSDGATAGTSGMSYRIEAVQIRIRAKGSGKPSSAGTALNYSFLSSKSIAYKTYVQSIGWQDTVSDGSMAGTTEKSLRIEAIQISSSLPGVGVSYRGLIQDSGWESGWHSSGVCGTTGKSKRLEAVQIKLTGSAASHFHVWYRVYAENYGWLGWAHDGESAGTENYSLRAEAIEIVVRSDAQGAPGSTSNHFYRQKTVREKYPQACAVLDKVGWNLQSAFNWCANLKYKSSFTTPNAGTRAMANVGFSTGCGNCYVMAACFTEMGRALGYEVYQMTGSVPLLAGGMGPHSWCEVVVNGQIYVCDPDFQYESGSNGYMIKYKTPGTWVYSNYSRMPVE